jgi:hypothetical protein
MSALAVGGVRGASRLAGFSRRGTYSQRAAFPPPAAVPQSATFVHDGVLLGAGRPHP